MLDRPGWSVEAADHGWEALRDKYSELLGFSYWGCGAVEDSLDVVAVRVTDERAEVAGVILRPEPRRVQ